MPWSFWVEVAAGRSTAAWLRVFREEEVRSDAEADARLLWTPLVACVVSFSGGGGGGALNTNGRGTTHANHRRCTIRVTYRTEVEENKYGGHYNESPPPPPHTISPTSDSTCTIQLACY
ncbi:hypothetical protein FQR65_LT07940 [Abscondita terminalis]|nr:hypothetical protein FQR65_LT07940 [Abscondita terminalis]